MIKINKLPIKGINKTDLIKLINSLIIAIVYSFFSKLCPTQEQIIRYTYKKKVKKIIKKQI